jgi:hypothetical protein
MGVKMAWEIYRDIPGEDDRVSALSLAGGNYSSVIKVPNPENNEDVSWAFFRSAEEPRTADLSVSENAEKARSYMRQFEGGRVENWLVDRAEKFIAGTKESGIAEAAESAGIELVHFGPVNLNYGNVNLFNALDITIPELYNAAFNENFWKASFTAPLNTPSVPFTLGESVVVIIPVEEAAHDETERGYISDWYAKGWMQYAMDRELNEIFSASKKFENKFGDTFFGNFLLNQF